MAGTPNPSADVIFANGQLKPLPDLGTSVHVKIGPSSAGPMLVPRRVASLSDVLGFKHGPLVGAGAHQVAYSQPCYLMRCAASTAGTFSSVTKAGAGSGPGTLAVAAQGYTVHAQAAAGAALSLTSGWTTPPAPLPLTITTTGGGVGSHTQTVTGINQDGNVVTEAVVFSTAATKSTTATFARVTSVTSNADPGGTSDYTMTFAGPQDRYNAVLNFPTGGQINLGTAPTYRYSFDGGKSWSSTTSLPSTGVIEFLSYAPGLTQQATGMKGTFTAGTVETALYGSLKIDGADDDGDVLYTGKAYGVTVAHVISGMGTAFSVAVVGSAITVNLATNGGGAATSTAADIEAGIIASAAASLLVTAEAQGDGLSIGAALSATTLNNGGVDYTAKTEGVRVRHVVAGNGTALSVSVVSKDITVYSATNSVGEPTSTATQAVAAIVASSAAAALVSAAVHGSGAGTVGAHDYTVLPTSFVTGDNFYFTTTPPQWSSSDLVAALNALTTQADTLSNISVVHVLLPAGSTDADSVQTWVDGIATTNRQYKFAVIEAPYQGSTAEATWISNVRAAFPTRSSNGKFAVCAGEVDTYNAAYGTQDSRNVATAYLARLMNCEISELPSHVECATLNGTQYAVPGLGSTLQTPGPANPVPAATGSALYQTDSALVELHSSSFVTFRTHPGLTGLFVRQGLMYVADGDDYTYVTNARIRDVAASLAYLETLRFLNSNLLTDPTTGQLAEIEARRIEGAVKARIADALLGGRRPHVTALDVVVDRSTSFTATGVLYLTVYLVGRSPAVRISTTLGFVRTLG